MSLAIADTIFRRMTEGPAFVVVADIRREPGDFGKWPDLVLSSGADNLSRVTTGCRYPQPKRIVARPDPDRVLDSLVDDGRGPEPDGIKAQGCEPR